MRPGFFVSSDSLAPRDIYAIEKVTSLESFLIPEQSLCIVHQPKYQIPEMPRVEGKNAAGEADRIYLCNCGLPDLGYMKNKLDLALKESPFLFISWKKAGHRTYRIFQNRKVIGEYPDLASALDAYLPEGFTPEKSYIRKRSIFSMWCLSMARASRLQELATLINLYKLKKETI